MEIHAIAHLTGGGWEGNLPRALPPGLGAAIDRAAWTVPALFTLLGDLGGVREEERFDTWNMGIGLVLAIAGRDAAAAVLAVPDAIALGRVERAGSGRRVRFA